MGRSRTRWLWITVLVIVLSLSLAAWALFKPGKAAKKALPSAVVKVMDMTSPVRATGTVRPQVGAEVKVGARISGQVKQLFANIGDQVKKGSVIAVLEHTDLKAKVAWAKARLREARARYALLKRGGRTEEIAAARASLKKEEAVERLARLELGRRRSLRRKNLISGESVDRARKDLEVARAKRTFAASMLAFKRKPYIKEDLTLAWTRIAQARAALELERSRLGYATIRAPISGVIAKISTQKGETVSVGLKAPTFVTIIDLDRLQVETFVDEVDIGKVKVGQAARFRVDAHPNRDFKGRVDAIYPNAVLQSNVVNYVAILAIKNGGGLLRPGMTANVAVQVAAARRRLGVPGSAIWFHKGRRFVWVLDGARRIKREVKIGRRRGRFFEVVNGLKPGERVLLTSGKVKR